MSDEFGPKIRVRIFDGMKTARCSCWQAAHVYRRRPSPRTLDEKYSFKRGYRPRNSAKSL